MPHSKNVQIQRIHGATVTADDDLVAIEEPLEIRIGYTGRDGRSEKPVSITMRTPGNDDELAAGFLFTEGIVGHRSEITRIWHRSPPVPGSDLRNVIRVDLGDETNVDFDRLQRHFYTSSSCGVCGKASLEALEVQTPFRDAIASSGFGIDLDRLLRLPEQLSGMQKAFGETGGIHASGLFDADGTITLVREDVGRHNAMDKLVGRLLLDGALPCTSSGVLLSGRSSFELMQKAAMAGVSLIGAVGAPSTLAVEVAREFGITLIGFLRDGRCNVYSGAQRVRV